MNAKGTKFLAVLAVMAMAFAAFAVIDATSDADPAVVKDVSLTLGTDINNVTEEGAALSAGTYFIGADVSVSVSSGIYIFFVTDGKELQIESTGAATVGIYFAKLKAGTTSTTTSSTDNNVLELYVKNGIQSSCLDSSGNWSFPASTSGITALADVDLPLIIDDVVIVADGEATLYAAGEVTVADGWTLAADVILDEGGSISLGEGSIFFGTVTYATDEDITMAALSLKAGSAAEIAAGSIELSGEFTAAEFALIIAGEGDIVLDGVTIISSDDPEENIPVAIAADVTVTGDGFTIDEGVVVAVSSNVVTEGDATIDNNGTIKQEAGGDMSGAAIESTEGTGTLDNIADPDDMKTQEQKGEATQDTVYPSNQVIRIVSGTTWTLVPGTEITIKGQLYVEEGAKIIIAPSAKLIITNAAIVDVAGEIVLQYEEDEEEYGFGNYWGMMEVVTGSINVSGSITVDGILTLDGEQMPYGTIAIDDGGVIVIGSTGFLIDLNNVSEIAVGYDGGLIVYGSLDIETIYNYGGVLINSGVPADGNVIIHQMADQANVIVEKFTVIAEPELLFTLTITDADLEVPVAQYDPVTLEFTGEYVDTKLADLDMANVITVTPDQSNGGLLYLVSVYDVNVQEYIYAFPMFDDSVFYYNNTAIYGDVGVAISYEGDDVAAENARGKVTVDIAADSTAMVPADLELEAATAGVTIVNQGNLDIYGYLGATVTTDLKSTFTNNAGIVTVYGNGMAAVRDSKMAATINACEFIEETSTLKTYFYVTIDNALDLANAGLDKVTVRGDNTVTRSNTIPANTVFTMEAGSTITIGTEDDLDVVLTVDDLGEIRGSNADIYVNGTMYAENQSKIKKTITIHSDVKTYETDAKGKEVKDGWAKWTNLTTALNSAQPGDEVIITRIADETQEYVYVKSNTTIKEGVTLDVPAGKAPLLLFNGVTLTVDGELDTAEDIFAETQFALKAKKSVNYNSSAVVVNGVLSSTVPNGTTYALHEVAPAAGNYTPMSEGAPIAGAYYKVGTANVISALDIAAWNVDNITGNITINGAVTSDAVLFSKSNTCSTIVLGNSINADIPTVLDATIALDGTKIVSTAVPLGGTGGDFNGKVIVDDSVVTVKGVTGMLEPFQIADKKGDLVLSGSYNLARGESITVTEGVAYTNEMFVDTTGTGKVAVGANGILEVADNASNIETLEVTGILYVPNGKQLTVGSITNAGSIIISPETETKAAGDLFIETALYDGIKGSDMHAAAPAVAGAFTLNDAVAYVINGAIFDDVAKERLATYKSTEFYVEGKLWFTAYSDANAAQINVNKAPITNADLVNWNNKADLSGTNRGFNPTVGQDAKLYAVINYNIYDVIIYTDSGINSGIKSVEIDGIPMVWQNNNCFVIAGEIPLLEAGAHTVKCTFVSGYTGTMSLYTQDGTLLKDMKFTTSGTSDADRLTTLFIKGSAQAIEPTPEPEPAPEPESEWNITTILLLVLVILIAIMVVIVALKLRRS